MKIYCWVWDPKDPEAIVLVPGEETAAILASQNPNKFYFQALVSGVIE